MGEAAKRKWAERTERAIQKALDGAAAREEKKKAPPAIRWSRGIGLCSLLVGVPSMMGTTYFWFSVAVIYTGFLVLLIDLYIEDFSPRSWVKLPIALAIVALITLFTQVAVLRKAPIMIGWRMIGDRLNVYVSNTSSEDDYTDVDLIIRTDPSSDLIVSPKQETHLPNLTIVDSEPPLTMEDKGETLDAITHPDGTPTDYYTNFLRFRCDKLPKNETVRFSMALGTLVHPEKDGAVIPASSITGLRLKGTLRGKFREFSIDQAGQTFVLLSRR